MSPMLAALFDHIQEAACLSDAERKIVAWNPAAERLTGYSAEEMRGRRSQELLEGDVLKPRQGQPVTLEIVTIPTAEGTVELWRPLELEPDAYVMSLAHELRSPLASMLGFASLLNHPRHGEIDPRKQEFARHIMRSIDHLSMLVGNLALGTTLERVEVQFEVVDLAELIREVAEIFSPLAEARRVSFHVRAPDRVDVWGERGLLRQVLHNLLSNAVRNTEAGEVSVGLTPRGELAEVEVRDTGRGIEPAMQPLLIRKFSWLPGHRRGLGLGLYVAHGLVRAHCGQFGLESEPGRGSRFFFCLERVC